MLIDRSFCTGCLACHYVCNEKAIELAVVDTFVYPIIDNSKCIKCMKCENICKLINTKLNTLSNTFCYAMQSSDEIRNESSSGGIFYLLAKYFLSIGGFVCGAAFLEGRVKHIIINSINDLSLLQRSKYIESNCYDAYKSIKKLLDENKKILFSGTPCQCSAVNRLFKNYENLYTIDLLCHGVPSQLLFEQYISEEYNNEEISDINFRYKKLSGWNQNLVLFLKSATKKYIINSWDDSFYSSFLNAYSIRESCFYCKYSNGAREGNITLGDFWGVDDFDKNINDKIGTSLVLINDEKGEQLISHIRKDLKLIREFPIEVAKKSIPIVERPCNYTSKRREFFSMIRTNTMKQTHDYLKNNIGNCGIINYWWCNDNGAILTAFALQNVLSLIGYTSRLINLSSPGIRNGISQRFEVKYLSTTEPINSYEQFIELNKSFDNFIVGSDQVFRAEWVDNHWFLDFVNLLKNKVAISASFGVDKLNIDNHRRKEIKFLLSRFNKISVREITGIKLCKTLGVRADYLIDPVFILDKEYYINLEKDSNLLLPKKGYIFCYFRDYNEKIKCAINNYSASISLPVILADDQTEVIDFLKLIHNANFVITDSYHGLCFSLIFNKPYVCYYNIMRGKTRFDTLIELLQLNQENFVFTIDDVEKAALSFFEDWSTVNTNIYNFQKQGISWIKKALDEKKQINVLKVLILYVCSHRLSLPVGKLKKLIKKILKKILHI